MNLNQVLSFVRAVLNLLGGSFVAKGYSDSSTWEAIAGGVLALVSVAWGLWHHTTPSPTTVVTPIPPTPPPTSTK